MIRIRKFVIGVMLIIYMAINSCDRTNYYTYHIVYHTISLDYSPNKIYHNLQAESPFSFVPGHYVKHRARFFPGINMISMNDYRFSLN